MGEWQNILYLHKNGYIAASTTTAAVAVMADDTLLLGARIIKMQHQLHVLSCARVSMLKSISIQCLGFNALILNEIYIQFEKKTAATTGSQQWIAYLKMGN